MVRETAAAANALHPNSCVALMAPAKAALPKFEQRLPVMPVCRCQDLWARQTVEQVLTEYDADDEDEAWLAKHNAKVSP